MYQIAVVSVDRWFTQRCMVHCGVAHVPDYSGLWRQVVHTLRCTVHCGWLMYQITVVSVDRWFTHRGVWFTVGGSCTRLQWSLETGGPSIQVSFLTGFTIPMYKHNTMPCYTPTQYTAVCPRSIIVNRDDCKPETIPILKRRKVFSRGISHCTTITIELFRLI